MPPESDDRRDQTPVILARLETTVASIKDDVAEIRLAQHTFVTHDRMELEIAARNNAMGQLSTVIAEHIRHAERLESDGKATAARIDRDHKEIIDRRITPLERDRDEMSGAFKTIKFLIYILGAAQAIQLFVAAGGTTHLHT